MYRDDAQTECPEYVPEGISRDGNTCDRAFGGRSRKDGNGFLRSASYTEKLFYDIITYYGVNKSIKCGKTRRHHEREQQRMIR